MILRRVDLPVPFGPTTPILAPCRNDSVTLSRTTLSPWALRTLRRVNTYSAMVPDPTGRAAPGPYGGDRQAASSALDSGFGVRVNALVPRLRSCPRWVASTSNARTSTFSLLTYVCSWSRPVTTTGSPRCSEVAAFSASERQTLTVYHWVIPSDQFSVRRLKRRGVQASRKLATGTSPARRSVTSLPSQPCR